MSKEHVRLANQDDINVIISFNQKMALETENRRLENGTVTKGVKAIFNNPQKGFYIVAEINETVRACLMISYEWSDWRNGLFWWIQSVFVEKEFRQKGLYRSLYAFIKERVDKNNDIVGIRLYVDNHNNKAKEVYKKLGMLKSNYQLFEYSKK